jgi:hypothetical protein
MPETKMNLKQWAAAFIEGKFSKKDVDTQCAAGWYDWFCKDGALAAKTEKLGWAILQIMHSPKFDMQKVHVMLKNNCPLNGNLYDDFRLVDGEGNVVYTIVPASGHKAIFGRAEVWGRENGFEKALVEGSWADVLRFFLPTRCDGVDSSLAK